MADYLIPESVPNFIKKFYKIRGHDTLTVFKSELFINLEDEKSNSSKRFVKTFRKLTTNNERINFIYEKLDKFNLLDDKFKLDAKSDSRAKFYQEKGDKCFVVRRFAKAARCYTKMLMQAFTPELITTAYMCRSAASFKLQLFEECVIDIDRALARDCDESQKDMLMKRRTRALQLDRESESPLKPYEKPPQIPTNQRNPVLHCASSCIEVKGDASSRRRVIAARNIKIGEVVAVETPYCAVVDEARIYHCHECFELCYAPIPCDNCTHTIYCGESCRQNAYNKYHREECPILHSLKDLVGRDKHYLLGMKMALLNQDEQADEVLRFNRDVDEKVMCNVQFQTALVAAFMYDLVKKHTQKFRGVNGEQVGKSFKDSLLNYLRICLAQISGIDEFCPRNEQGEEDHIVVATGVYPIFGLFRHSCAPNVFASHHGLKRVLRALRTIKKGQECFISFGVHYTDHPLKIRQNQLHSQHHFECHCRACREDWPQLGRPPLAFDSERDVMCMYELIHLNVEFAKRIIPSFIAEIARLEQFEPRADLITQQKLLLRCFEVLGNKRLIS